MRGTNWWIVITVVVGLSIVLLGCGEQVPVGSGPQPIEFNHQKHLVMGLDCTICHTQVTTKAVAGPPSVETCMMCHAQPLTDNPQEEIIRTTAKAGKELKWRQITLVPDYVYFSHARHVAVGKIECENCHGDMSTRTVPLTRPAVMPSMEFCIGCHSRRTVSVDCVACHR